VDVQAQGIERPFIAYPPGSAFGRMAKYDSSVITDEERQKLNDAKIKFGANELAWEQMSGGSPPPSISDNHLANT
jgi:lupus La protein